jgi:hypothetical protein
MYIYIYIPMKMVVRPKHVAAKLNKIVKTVEIELRRRKPLTLIAYSSSVYAVRCRCRSPEELMSVPRDPIRYLRAVYEPRKMVTF